MNSLALAVIAIMIMVYFDIGLAMSPITPPIQYGQFCEAQKISGHGVINTNTSIEDSETCVGYHSSMAGDGDIEINQVQVFSQREDKLLRRVDSLNSTNDSNLNLFDNLKLTYSGSTPLIGEKDLSGAFGANIKEAFAVYQLEKDQTAFIASTKDNKTKSRGFNPVHTTGLDTKNSFNGTWSTDATWKEVLSKDIKAHEKFKGLFEIEKSIKFHEDPESEKKLPECIGIDC